MVIRSVQSSHKTSLVVLAVLLAGLTACTADPVTTAPPLVVQQYVNSCSWCHDDGIGGAPKTGDKEDWARRTSKGMAQVYANAIDGFEGATGIMPAKGSRMDMSDEEIKKIVDYMVEVSQ
jgi:cytochrome c5